MNRQAIDCEKTFAIHMPDLGLVRRIYFTHTHRHTLTTPIRQSKRQATRQKMGKNKTYASQRIIYTSG